MSIIYEHLPFYREFFSIKGFLQGPFLMIGIPRMMGYFLPEDFDYPDLLKLLKAKGVDQIYSLDLFDDKADIQHDLNLPIPKKEIGKYKVVFDMGSIEHVFDTKQCLQNYFSLVKKGGLLAIVTPVNGYCRHGYHVFNPEMFQDALKQNGFEIVCQKYSTSTGIQLSQPNVKKDVLIWLVAKKVKQIKKFQIPQQSGWDELYKKGQSQIEPNFSDKVIFYLKRLKRVFFKIMPRFIQRLYLK